MRIGIHGPEDFLALLVRRKWWIIVPFIAISCGVVLLTALLPETFVSETLILVQPREVPEQFVMDLIAGTTQQRLTTIERTVLSRTIMLQILRQFDGELEGFDGLSLDGRVGRLRSQIQISFQLATGAIAGRQELTSFRIAYQNQNPELAQKIASELTQLFIQQDNRVRESQVLGTTEFLSAELATVTEQLRESTEELAVMRTARQSELPQQLEANLRTLDRLGIAQQTNAETLDRYAAMRLSLERQLSETPEMVPQAQTGQAPRPANPLVGQYRQAVVDYEDAQARYTPEHPAVLAARIRMERLEAQIPPEDLAAAGQPQAGEILVPNPLYQSLATQLDTLKTDLELREKQRETIEADIERYSRRVENTPRVEQEIADVLRRNSDLQAQYDSLRSNLSQAELAESLENSAKGTQFVIVDPANYPLEPSKPDKPYVALAGVLGSLVFAIGLALVVDILRQRVWTGSEIEAFWGAPVLIDIPQIVTDSDLATQRKRKFAYAASSVAAAAVYAVCLYGVYVKHEPIIQLLDPVLQRLVYQ